MGEEEGRPYHIAFLIPWASKSASDVIWGEGRGSELPLIFTLAWTDLLVFILGYTFKKCQKISFYLFNL